MDKKYKAIKTLKELDLSRGTRSSLSSISGKSDFSTKSQEEAFNKAYANDFSMTPPKKDTLRLPTKPKILPPIKNSTIFYSKALKIAETFKKNLEHPKQKELVDDVLANIKKVLDKNKGDDYEEMELPSKIDSVFQKYARKYSENTFTKYIYPLRFFQYNKEGEIEEDKLDYTTFEGQLDKLVSEIYNPPDLGTTPLSTPASSRPSSASSAKSFMTNSSYKSSSSNSSNPKTPLKKLLTFKQSPQYFDIKEESPAKSKKKLSPPKPKHPLDPPSSPPKKRGRPKGSKNKPK